MKSVPTSVKKRAPSGDFMLPVVGAVTLDNFLIALIFRAILTYIPKLHHVHFKLNV
jgi:hypothetical protein